MGTVSDSERNQDRGDQGYTADNSQMRNNLEENRGVPTPDSREHKDVIISDITTELVRADWRLIARFCDAVCFASFLAFHVLSIVAIVFLLS